MVIAVLLVVIAMGLAGSYLVISEVVRARGEEQAALKVAREAAESGIDHMRVHLLGLVDPDSVDPAAAWDTVLATNDGTPDWAVEVATSTGSYTVRILDNDDGDGDLLNDSDGIVVIESVGTSTAGASDVIVASVFLETYDTTEGFAILTGDDLAIFGNEVVDGTRGSVHANGDLGLTGNASISQNATSSGQATVTGGSVTVGGTLLDNQPTVPIKPVVPADYRPSADYVLASDGRVLDGPTGVVVADLSTPGGPGRGLGLVHMVSTFNGFTYSSVNGWSTTTSGWVDGMYYVEGDFTFNHGGTEANPWVVTIVAEGDISMQGNPYLEPYFNATELFVAGGDVYARGTGANAEIEGLILAHEQVSLDGNITYAGRIVAEAYENTPGSAVDSMTSSFGGSVAIAYNGGMTRSLTTTYRLPVRSWSEDLVTNLAP